MFAVVMTAVALAAVLFTAQPWYAWATSGPAGCTPSATAPRISTSTPANTATVHDVYAAGCLSGTGLADAFTPADGVTRTQLGAMDIPGAAPTPDVMLGLPRTTVLLLGALALGIFGLWGRNGLLSGLGVVLMYFAHRDLGALSSLMLSGAGGKLTQTMPGLAHYGEALLVGWTLLVSSTVLVVRVNSDQRAFDTIAAQRDGVPGPLSPLDHVTSLVGGRLAKLADSVAEQRTSETAKSRAQR